MTSRSWNLRGGVVNPPPLRPNAHKEYEGPRHLGSTNTVKIIAKIGNRCHPYIQKGLFSGADSIQNDGIYTRYFTHYTGDKQRNSYFFQEYIY